MQNLSERNGTFSSALVARQDVINACVNPQQVATVIQDIINTDISLKKSAVEYGRKILSKIRSAKSLSTAWQIVYNVILAGDSCGCFWSTAAETRKR